MDSTIMTFSQLSIVSGSDTSSTAPSSPNLTRSFTNDSMSITGDDTSSISSSETIDFKDRSIQTRNARLANALNGLDEDLPQHVDESIKILFRNHTNVQSGALGNMEFLVDENYLEYKNSLAARRAMEKKLPKSKGRRASLQQ